MRCLYQCWFLKKVSLEREGIACFTPWVHPVCDVATASQPTLVN